MFLSSRSPLAKKIKLENSFQKRDSFIVMMRMKRIFSLSIKLLAICALIFLGFAHNFNFTANFNPGIRAVHHNFHEHKSSGKAIASQICSKAGHAAHGPTIGHEQQDNSPCHDGAPCHACRIGSSMLAPPDSGQIGQAGFRQLAVFSLKKNDTCGIYFVKSNASPRSPPKRAFA